MVTKRQRDPMFVSKARKKELDQILQRGLEKYSHMQAWKDVTRELKAQKAAESR